jgi:octaprenyl-diphosphate synthase
MDEIEGLLAAIEGEVRAALPESIDAEWAASNLDGLDARPYGLDSLLRPLRALAGRGGKRWRPLLMVLSSRAFGGSDEAALKLCPLVELPHTGSLVLDDIEDGAATRRGGPAAHIEYGLDVAINSGCAAYFLPLSRLEGIADHETRARLYGSYGRAMRRLHAGQALDIAWHKAPECLPSREDHALMCRLKTGAMARLAAEAGAILAFGARGTHEEAALLARCAEDLGVGFQALDDAANLARGNPGKARGDDVVEGKKSLPLIIACEREPALRPRLAGLMARAAIEGPLSAAVGEFIGLVEGTGAVAEAERVGAELTERSFEGIDEVCRGKPEAERLSRALRGLVHAKGRANG